MHKYAAEVLLSTWLVGQNISICEENKCTCNLFCVLYTNPQALVMIL